MSIQEVIRRHANELMGKANVTGVAEGERDGKPVIKVYVTHKVPDAALQPDTIIPKTLEGYEIDVEESGVITAQPKAHPQ